MEAVRLEQMVITDGQMMITGLPFRKGEWVEVIVLPQAEAPGHRSRLTVGRLRQSGLIGLWKDREDLEDSSNYARQLREEAYRRGDLNDLVG